MKASSLLLSAALLLPAAGAMAQAQVQVLPAVPDEQELAGCYPVSASRPATRGAAGRGSITYFGVVSSHDCHHEQFAQLRQAFEANKPTVVFFEKPDCGIDSTETATISRWGEGGYVRFLAQQHHVPALRLDDPLAEYEYLKTKIDPEQLKLYYLLRETQRRYVGSGRSAALAKKAMRALIAASPGFLPGTEQVIRNQAELEAAYRTHCPGAGKWWKAPAAWFGPTPAEAGAAPAFFASINHAIREFREHYTLRQLTDQAQAGQRVFVVMSRDHLPTPAFYSTLTKH